MNDERRLQEMTANQVVAYNLRFAREAAGLKQEEAAERLEPFLGERWSKATFSVAERSVAGKRVREFDADEIVAFSRAFELPIAWFLMPPLHDRWKRLPRIAAPERGKAPRITPDELVDSLLTRAEQVPLRVASCWPYLSPETRKRALDHWGEILRAELTNAEATRPIDKGAEG